MTNCEWESTSGPLRRFCTVHRCWCDWDNGLKHDRCPLGVAEAAIAEVREIHRIVSPHWRPKTLREKLCQQEPHAPDDETREAIARLIAILDRHRPLGSDGKHGDLHTATCGCELDGVKIRTAARAIRRVLAVAEGDPDE